MLFGLSFALLINRTPEIEPFKDSSSFMTEGWQISTDDMKNWEAVSLPTDITIQKGESVAIKTVLTEQLTDQAVMFFKTNDTSVSVTLDGKEIYATGYDGKLIGRVWHFIELPNNPAGKTLIITQKQVLREFLFRLSIQKVDMASSAAAVFSYLNRNHLFIFYASTVLCLISIVILFIALYDIRKNSQAGKLLNLSVMLILIALWSISESPITQLYFSGLYLHKPYLLVYTSFYAGLLFTVPAMLYFGEYYERKKAFGRLALITMMIAVILCIIDLFTDYTIVEMFLVILIARSANLSVILAYTLLHMLPSKKLPRQSKLFMVSSIITCAMGVNEALRLIVLGKQTVSFLFYAGMAFFLFTRVFESITGYMKDREHTHSLAMLVEMQRDYYPMITERINEIRVAEHDLRHHVTVLQNFADNGETDKIMSYIAEFYGKGTQNTPLQYCDHYVTNVLLHHFAARAAAHGIRTSIKADIPESIFVLDADICAVLNNLLENAIEACESVPEGSKRITVTAGYVDNIFVLEVENSFDGYIEYDARGFQSRKAPNREGIGLASVRAVAVRYDGDVQFAPDNERGVFHSSVMLQPTKPAIVITV